MVFDMTLACFKGLYKAFGESSHHDYAQLFIVSNWQTIYIPVTGQAKYHRKQTRPKSESRNRRYRFRQPYRVGEAPSEPPSASDHGFTAIEIRYRKSPLLSWIIALGPWS